MFAIPVAVAVLLAIVLGLAVLELAWPVLVIWTALVYCLGPGVSKQTRRVIDILALIAFAVGYQLGPWENTRGPGRAAAWFVGPLVVAAFLIAIFGGPKRLRARRARHERAQAELRVERARLARANRVARKADRALGRRQSIRARTGVDLDLLAEAARNASVSVRRAGGQLRRAARRRPPGASRTAGEERTRDDPP